MTMPAAAMAQAIHDTVRVVVDARNPTQLEQWTQWASIIAATFTVVAALAAVVATIVAKRGISEWRRQLREAVAERCREAVIRLRDAIESARVPLETAGLGVEGELDDIDRIKRDRGAYSAQCRQLMDADAALGSLKPGAEIRFGAVATQHIDALRGLVSQLRGASTTHFDKRRAGIEGKPDVDALVAATAVMYSLGHFRNDAFGQESVERFRSALAYFEDCARL